MNREKLKIEIDHILDSGANSIRLMELFDRYKPCVNTFFDLRYFHNESSLCADDFKREERVIKINPRMIIAVSALKVFVKPFSGQSVDYYSIVHINGGLEFAIKSDSYQELMQITY